MRIKLYIEAKEGESWRDLSRPFCQWLEKRVVLSNFALGEADTIKNDSVNCSLIGFDMKEEYSDYIEYFEDWAASLGRVYGHTKNNKLNLSNGVSILLPKEESIEVPPWLQ